MARRYEFYVLVATAISLYLYELDVVLATRTENFIY